MDFMKQEVVSISVSRINIRIHFWFRSLTSVDLPLHFSEKVDFFLGEFKEECAKKICATRLHHKDGGCLSEMRCLWAFIMRKAIAMSFSKEVITSIF